LWIGSIFPRGKPAVLDRYLKITGNKRKKGRLIVLSACKAQQIDFI